MPAQMIYNGLDAKVITKSNSVNQATGEIITIYTPTNQSVANKYLSLEEVSGELTKIDYNKKDSVYKYTVGESEYESAVNYIALFGQNVKVLYKTEKGKTVVYGMYADESSVLYEGVWGDVDSSTLNTTKKTVKIDGTEYKLDSSSILTPVAVTYGKVDSPAAVAAYSEIKVVDNDNDGDIDKIVYTPVAVNKITFVGKTQFTLENGGTKTIEDEITYDGMAKNDFVAVTYDVKSDKDVYTKLEMLKDVKVTSTKGDTATINGTAYKNTIEGAKVVAGTKYGTVAILNGYIVKTDSVTTEGDVTKYAVITGLKTVTDYDTTYKAKLLMSSGEEVEVTAKSIDGLKVGQLVNFEVNDDVYTLTDSVNNGFDKATYAADFIAETKDASAKMTFKQPSESAGTYGIADDAVVFIKNVVTKNNGETEDVYSVIKGSELAKKSSATVVKAYADENKSTGFTNVVLAYVSQANADKTTYAYVTDDPVKNVDDKNVTTYEISLSTGTFTTTNNLSVSSDIKKGAIVSYTVNADNKISAIATTGTKDAVTAYDGKNIKLNTAAATYQFTDDATIIYIDSSAKKVAEGGNITLADKNAESHYVNNVIYTLKDGKVDLLVVDVNNEMK